MPYGDRQRLQAAEGHVIEPFRSVAEQVHRRQEPHERAKRDAPLGARKRRSQAEMDSMAEGHMQVRLTGNIEAVWVRKLISIPVCRSEHL